MLLGIGGQILRVDVQRGQLLGQPEKAVLSAVRKGGVPMYRLGREGAQGVSDCGGLTESCGASTKVRGADSSRSSRWDNRAET